MKFIQNYRDFPRKLFYLLNHSAKSQKTMARKLLFTSHSQVYLWVAQVQWFPIVCEWICYNRITHEVYYNRIMSTFLNQNIIVVFGNLASTKGKTGDSLENIVLGQWFSKCESQSSSIPMTQELVRNLNPGVSNCLSETLMAQQLRMFLMILRHTAV